MREQIKDRVFVKCMREKINNALLMIHFNFSDNFRLYSAEYSIIQDRRGNGKRNI